MKQIGNERDKNIINQKSVSVSLTFHYAYMY